jgi:hypothetical protein
MRHRCAAALAILLLSAGTLNAAPFTILDVDGAFLNAIPAVTINNADPDHITARWGTPAGAGGQSGYNFDSLVPPVVGGVVPPTSAWFQLGNFTHLNQPVSGTFLSSIQLNVILDFVIGVTFFNNTVFSYTLTHDETPNATPCPGFQQSAVPCDDRVIVSAPSDGVFDVDGTLFTLELGFSSDGGDTILSEFITTEQLNNVAGLYGRFSAEVVPVPEPGSLSLIGVALGAAVLRLRRRRTRAVS